MPAAGTVIVHIPAGAATAIHNGNLTEESTSTDNVVTFVPFTVTINQASGQADPTSTFPVRFDVVFSEPVTGFTVADVVISGTAGAIATVFSGSGATYTVEATPTLSILGTVNSPATNPRGISVDGNNMAISLPFTDTVELYDVSDPTNIVFKDSLSSGTNFDFCYNVVCAGNYIYCASRGQERVSIINITDPNNIVTAGTIRNATSLYQAWDIVKQGKYVYVTGMVNGDSTKGRLTIVDVSVPATPTIVSTLADTALAYGGQSGTERNSLAVQGNYVYVAARTGLSGTRCVTVVDVSNPATPTVVHSYANATIWGVNIQAITVDGDYAYVTGSSATAGNMAILNISNPLSITLASITNTFLGSAYTSVKHGNYLYFLPDPGQIRWMDVTDPTAPVYANTASFRFNSAALNDCHDMAIEGDTLFVSNVFGAAVSAAAVTTLDPPSPSTVIANIPAAVAISTITGTANPASTSTDNVVTWESTPEPPARPSFINYINTVSLAEQPWGIAISGTYALVACGGANDRVLVLDLAAPALPVVIGTVINSTALNTARDIAIYGSDRAVVAAQTAGRAVLIGFSTPTAPSILDSEAGYTGPLGMGVVGDHAIMADSDGDMIASFDLSVANNISTADTLSDAWIASPSSVSIEGTIAAVPNESSLVPRLNLIDVSDPTNLSIIGSISDPDLDSGSDVRLRDGIAWVTAYGGSAALTAVDCSTPSTPTVIGTLVGSGIGIAFTIELYVTAAGTFPIVSDFTTDEINLIDGRDPTAMTLISTSSVGAPATIRRMAVYQNYVYVIESLGGSLRVLEIT